MDTLKKPELLVPAGGLEQLEYALLFGADAIYIGGEHFGLRMRADNFTDGQMAQAVSKVHAAQKKLYVTCNVMMHEDDLAPFEEYVRMLDGIGVDAVIVSDLGTLAALHETAPDISIHVSTQASVTNSRAALLWYAQGARRIVLARELSIEEIAAIRNEVPDDLELEVFVHGAMCMAYSGRCLISNYLTGRDANKGHCTQSCRWTYVLEEAKRPGEYFPIDEDETGSFIMSSTDLCMLEHLDDLRNAGVNSIKIEGRVKGAYYVATVTNAYRRVLDGEDPAEYLSELDAVSHRPYDTGFFYGQAGQAPHGEEYLQSCDLVATVVSSERCDNGWLTTVTERNRFFSGDTLEVLSPEGSIRDFIVSELRTGHGQEVPDASKTLETYTLTTPFELMPRDIIRKRR